ncbi:hypothetical protein [Paraburkholderia metrosideri]|uniref:Uncharacterized protein n=1 Tax=Paraburkholderia metrosideri TaxID=580937 RepID=A0ABM8NRP1_9BURK|nr:hypothetical protein [Paraburkholderia metrosideri]CAD6540296.1 hypothetical protein LMG28140_03483 [Paraburkholderia metrosideri]
MIELIRDTILPGDTELGMPPASSVDFELYQIRHGISGPVDKFVELVADVARKKFNKEFEQLDESQRLVAINGCKVVDVRLFSTFITHALRAYYTDRRVLYRLSVGAIPPFPAGNELGVDDWTILEPVYERGPIYRDDGSA